MIRNNYELSVIIPVYNAEKYLKKTLGHSLKYLNDCQIILINDGSTDNSLNILEEFKKKYSNIIIINKTNGGVSSARNVGMKAATGKYIMFLDSDDLISKNICEIKKIINNYDYDIIKCDYKSQRKIKFIYKYISCLKQKTNTIIDKKTIYKSFLENSNFNSVWSQIIKRKLTEKITFDEKYVMAEDLDFNLKIYTKAKKIYYYKKDLIKYQYNDKSATRDISFQKCKKQLCDILEVYTKLYDYNKKWLLNEKKDIIDKHIEDICGYIIHINPNYTPELLNIYNDFVMKRGN